MIFQPIEPVPSSNMLPEVPLGADFLRQLLSADLLEVIGEDVGTRIWSEDGGATFEGAINLFDQHWITFDLRSFLLGDLPKAGEAQENENRADRRRLAAFLRWMADEVELGERQHGSADAGKAASDSRSG